MITIIEYVEKYQPQFYKLNEIWLDKYNLKESHDLLILNNPEQMIISKGGFIWLAKTGDDIVGTVALIKETDEIFELAKMAVDDEFKGRGISKILIETAINKAKQLGAKKLELFSNHQLIAALQLYKKYGFTQIEVSNYSFKTADVKMELVL